MFYPEGLKNSTSHSNSEGIEIYSFLNPSDLWNIWTNLMFGCEISFQILKTLPLLNTFRTQYDFKICITNALRTKFVFIWHSKKATKIFNSLNLKKLLNQCLQKIIIKANFQKFGLRNTTFFMMSDITTSWFRKSKLIAPR